ncbi:MAG: hypothetical protein ACI9VX_001437, partial [Dinoroseobacter sp.]
SDHALFPVQALQLPNPEADQNGRPDDPEDQGYYNSHKDRSKMKGRKPSPRPFVVLKISSPKASDSDQAPHT